ncbi:DUF2513 domain-containing protein [Salipiger manganoxidans]|uniref:DUF2513 domain-containing protein n=1 Tax=Salipiger marinus TaxID=555512 RepID=UPI001E5B02A9|nr:DUF2513 domain-containing protein [Salipiger manganoxidans]MCD1621075.1 DUF2513 domain-containing protein [Salipiger manganoxidans]
MTDMKNRPNLQQVILLGIRMKRDDELVKQLLIEMEDSTEAVHFYGLSDPDEADGGERKYYHLRLMQDAGLVEESGRHGCNWRMTNAGHDFVGLIRDAGMWAKMKERAAQVVPSYGLKLLYEVGHALARQKLRDMGLPLE